MLRMLSRLFDAHTESGQRPLVREDEVAEELNINVNPLGHRGLDLVFEHNDPEVDIVFVDGLSGDRKLTWSHGENMWPRDYLPRDLPKARILMFGYDSWPALSFGPAYADTILCHGRALATELAMERLQQQHTERPLIFVAHSLGGLICEQALLIARDASEPYMNGVIDATAGVMFMGTPHSGADLAAGSSILTNIMRIHGIPNETDLKSLKAVSKALSGLQQSFRTMLKARKDRGESVPGIFSFFESMDHAPIGRIVPRESAILQPYPSQSISANHVDMVKFASATESGYRSVLYQLRVWLMNMNKQQPRNSAQSVDPQAADCGLARRIYHTNTFRDVNNVIQGDILSTKNINFGSGGMIFM